HLVTLHLERNGLGQCESACSDLLSLAEKLREGSELPFARALLALCAMARRRAVPSEEFDSALAALRRADSKHRLAFICSCAARYALEREDTERARVLGEEALAAATAIGRASDMAMALAILVRVA